MRKLCRYFYDWEATFKDGWREVVSAECRREAIIRVNLLANGRHGPIKRIHKIS